MQRFFCPFVFGRAKWYVSSTVNYARSQPYRRRVPRSSKPESTTASADVDCHSVLALFASTRRSGGTGRARRASTLFLFAATRSPLAAVRNHLWCRWLFLRLDRLGHRLSPGLRRRILLPDPNVRATQGHGTHSAWQAPVVPGFVWPTGLSRFFQGFGHVTGLVPRFTLLAGFPRHVVVNLPRQTELVEPPVLILSCWSTCHPLVTMRAFLLRHFPCFAFGLSVLSRLPFVFGRQRWVCWFL